ncbi:MAG: alpha/beta hydrolase [Oscillospiraceae bacterium]|nr:alpha/beta hydrolase [Oscillospiraceae bacterium]
MEELDIKTTRGNIHVYKQGNGEKKIILLHGSGCDSAMLSWREVMGHFSEHFTVYAPDQLGYGKSDKPENMAGDRFYDIHIETLREVADSLGLEKFALSGLSMGGAVAMGFALRYGERVTALFPVDPWGISEKIPFGKFSLWYIHKTDLTLKQFRWIANSRFMAKWLASYALIGDKKNITDELIDEMLEACRADGAGKAMQDYQRSSCTEKGVYPYYVDELSKLKMPVAFVSGEKDPLVPKEDVIRAAKEVGTEAHILKNCKHWSVKEMPENFCGIVENMLT